MDMNVITIILTITAVVSLLLGSVLLIRFNWFSGWLIGSIGLGSLTVALICSVILLSFNAYLSTSTSDSVASISFTKIATKHYKVELSETQGQKSEFEMKGDLWQVDADIIRWNSFFEKQGLKPYFRLKSIKSSYAMLDDAEQLSTSMIEIETTLQASILSQIARNKSISFIHSVTGTTGALPMVDGALFSIRLNKAGLITKPENQQAFSAIR